MGSIKHIRDKNIYIKNYTTVSTHHQYIRLFIIYNSVYTATYIHCTVRGVLSFSARCFCQMYNVK